LFQGLPCPDLGFGIGIDLTVLKSSFQSLPCPGLGFGIVFVLIVLKGLF
jgi:hypothetical protein